MDHQPYAENLKTEMCKGEVFKATEKTDEAGENDSPKTGANAVDVGYVAGISYGKAMDDLEVGVEVAIPETNKC